MDNRYYDQMTENTDSSIILGRTNKNPNELIFGVAGAGKGFRVGQELDSNDGNEGVSSHIVLVVWFFLLRGVR